MTDRTAQVVTVNHTRGYHARVTWWVRTDAGWRQGAQARDGRIGYGGLVRPPRREQGTGTTPLGTLPAAVRVRHRIARSDTLAAAATAGSAQGDYWVQDNASAYYNRYRNKAQGGFRWWLPSSRIERLRAADRLPRAVRVRRSSPASTARRCATAARAIFLHVNGSGATGGCVSAPRWFMRRVMAPARPREAAR